MPADVDITLIILVAMIAGVPILGVTFRLAIKPVVEAILLLQESFTESAPTEGLELRLSRLEEDIRLLSRAIEPDRDGTRG